MKSLAAGDLDGIGQALRNRLRPATDRLTDVMKEIEQAFDGLRLCRSSDEW